MDVAAEITATEFSEVIRTHFGLLYLFFFYAVAAALTSICARKNKREIYRILIPVGGGGKLFCGFTSRKVVFAREEALRIANTDRARWHGNAVAFVYESHDQRLPPSHSFFSGHA